MKASQFSDEQIVQILQQVTCRKPPSNLRRTTCLPLPMPGSILSESRIQRSRRGK